MFMRYLFYNYLFVFEAVALHWCVLGKPDAAATIAAPKAAAKLNKDNKPKPEEKSEDESDDSDEEDSDNDSEGAEVLSSSTSYAYYSFDIGRIFSGKGILRSMRMLSALHLHIYR